MAEEFVCVSKILTQSFCKAGEVFSGLNNIDVLPIISQWLLKFNIHWPNLVKHW